MSKEDTQKSISPDINELWNGQSYRHLTPEIVERLNNLLEFTQPGDLREHLLEIYHSYILRGYDSLPGNFKELADGVQMLLDFLKLAQKELNARQGSEPNCSDN